MNVTITGKQIDLGDALRVYIEDNLQRGVAKYFDRAVDAQVVLRREGPMFQCEAKIHVGAGIDIVAKGEAIDIYPAVDDAIAHIEKQARRDKRKRRNHHSGPQAPAELA